MSNIDMLDKTDWDRVDSMTDEEAYANALSDPDCPPMTQRTTPLIVRLEDGKTFWERFHKALDREQAR